VSIIKMEWDILVGIVIGFCLSIISMVLKKEYEVRVEKRLKKESIRDELAENIASFCTYWEDRRCSIDMEIGDFRENVKTYIKDIQERYRAGARYLDQKIISEIREVCNGFISITNQSPDFDDEKWFNSVNDDGNKLNERFDNILSKL